jgi:hypothetical protein
MGRVFTLTSVTSLLLCLGTIVLWKLSYRVAASLRHRSHSGRVVIVESRRGILIWECMSQEADPRFGCGFWTYNERLDRPWASDWYWADSYVFGGQRHIAGITAAWGERLTPGLSDDPLRTTVTTSYTAWGISVPLAYIVSAFALPPIIWGTLRFRARRRMLNSRCVRCGYALAGNVSGTCPECGTRVTAPPRKLTQKAVPQCNE